MIYDKNLILPYYKIEQTEEGKQFFFSNFGYFNFWDELLILHTKESEGKMFCCLVNRTNTKFSGGKFTEKQRTSFRTAINNSVYHKEPKEMFKDFPELAKIYYEVNKMENRCVCCGEIIPEGRQVCKNCEQKFNKDNKEKEIKL